MIVTDAKKPQPGIFFELLSLVATWTPQTFQNIDEKDKILTVILMLKNLSPGFSSELLATFAAGLAPRLANLEAFLAKSNGQWWLL